MLETRSVAPRLEIDRAAKHLVGATHPMIIAGDGVASSDAQPELTRLD